MIRPQPALDRSSADAAPSRILSNWELRLPTRQIVGDGPEVPRIRSRGRDFNWLLPNPLNVGNQLDEGPSPATIDRRGLDADVRRRLECLVAQWAREFALFSVAGPILEWSTNAPLLPGLISKDKKSSQRIAGYWGWLAEAKQASQWAGKWPKARFLTQGPAMIKPPGRAWSGLACLDPALHNLWPTTDTAKVQKSGWWLGLRPWPTPALQAEPHDQLKSVGLYLSQRVWLDSNWVLLLARPTKK